LAAPTIWEPKSAAAGGSGCSLATPVRAVAAAGVAQGELGTEARDTGPELGDTGEAGEPGAASGGGGGGGGGGDTGEARFVPATTLLAPLAPLAVVVAVG
jgi:hypothetical protein